MIFLVFLEKPFIDIKESWKKVWEVNVTSQKEQATLTVKYSAYPDPNFKWYVHSRNVCR